MGKQPTDSREFDEFWRYYPRCIDKRGTRVAYERALKRGHTHADIMAGLWAYPFSRNREYIPHSTTWLNQERYLGYKECAPQTVIVPQTRSGWMDKYDGGPTGLPKGK
jgi:hypothetical protein